MNPKEYSTLIQMALEEDLGADGDVTSTAVFTDERSNAVLFSKQQGILAGSGLFSQVFFAVDPQTEVEFLVNDGDTLSPGDRLATVRGNIASILSAERTAINFLAFLSGIATETRKYVDTAKNHGGAIILDTRKTLPGYRALSKYAVSVGGAQIID